MTVQSTAQKTRVNFLRRVLQANAIFSGLSGLVCIIDSGPLAMFLGLNAPIILVVTGILLVLYAAMLFYTAAQEPIRRHETLAFVVMDAAWVIGSIVILLAGWPALTTGGKWVVTIVADVVAIFAVLQYYGLRQMSKS